MSNNTLALPRTGFVIAAATLAWMAAVIWAAQAGVLAALGRAFMPGYAILVALGIGAPVAAISSFPSRVARWTLWGCTN